MNRIYMSESEMPKNFSECPLMYCQWGNSNKCDFKHKDECVPCPFHSLEAHDAEVRKAAIEETIRRIMCEAVPYRCVAPHGNEDEAVEAVDIGTIVKIEKELIENGRKDD